MPTSYHLADVLQQFLSEYSKEYSLSPQQRQSCQHILDCRSGKLGSQRWQCSVCEHEQIVHCSCRDRHCPRCQGKHTQKWVEKQAENVLPAQYFHVVFTLPHELNVVSRFADNTLYRSLFKAVWETLSKFASNRPQAKGQLGVTAVLHTWGQTLSQHIHLHCLIPGGVLNTNGAWLATKGKYLYPVKAMSNVFRAKMLSVLRRENIVIPDADKLMAKSWSVYSKPCLTKPHTVIEYLSRYTQKGMLRESRLVNINSDSVCFKYKDYRQPEQSKVMTISGVEFIRRYLQHVLPKGFMRIRHFGYLANRCRRKKLAQIKRCCQRNSKIKVAKQVPKQHKWPCPACQSGELTRNASHATGILAKGSDVIVTPSG